MAADIIRMRAREIYRTLCGGGPATFPLVEARELMRRAEELTGITTFELAPADGLLAGAHAVLDRECGYIWYCAANGPSEQRRSLFAIAHEFAHYWLHPLCPLDRVEIDEDQIPDMISGSGSVLSATVADGYSPQERREREANLFAAELLLPSPAALQALSRDRLSASQIAGRTGLSLSLVLAQLSYALSLPLNDTHGTAADAPAAFAPPLDPSQRRAVEIASGPALIDAGPGTGKTRTLVARAVHLLEVLGVAPENLLLLTFSNRAADEMRTRLRAVVGERADRAWIGTFHAFGMELLRKEGARIGVSPVARLVELTDAVGLLEQNLDRLKLSAYEYLSDPSLPFVDFLRCISRAKDELVTPAGYRAAAERMQVVAADAAAVERAAKALEVARVYEVYEELLRTEGLLDFGDLILRSIELFDSCPDVLDRWRAQFTAILADEYQDVNHASAALVSRLAGEGSGFWAVGDVRQAIYRFRGASPGNLTRFEQDYAGGIRLRLDINYRSVHPIVALAANLANCMVTGPDAPAQWHAPRGEARRVLMADADDEAAQADGIARSIRDRQAQGIALPGQAVLCATNGQCAALAAELERRGVPIRLSGGLLERREIKELLAVLAVATEPAGTALKAVASLPEYGVSAPDIEMLWKAADAEHAPFPGALSLAETLPGVSPAGRIGLALLSEHMRRIAYSGDAWTALCRYLFEVSGYIRPLLEDDSPSIRQSRLAIHRLLAFAQAQSLRLRAAGEPDPLHAFLPRFRLLLLCGEARIGGADAEQLDAVRILTVHQSKGLEFPVVYLPNLNAGQFPTRAMGSMASPPPELDPDAADGRTAEEADLCLFFVAITRARDELILSRPLRRNGKPTERSPLLGLLDDRMLERIEWCGEQVQAASGPAAGSSLLPGTGPPDVSISAVDQYRQCPRQFYYQRVVNVPGGRDDSAYGRFHTVLRSATDWLRAERLAGREPADADAAGALEALLDAAAPPDTASAHARILRERARTMFEVARHAGSTGEPATLHYAADLEHGRIRLSCDEASRGAGGELHLVKFIRRTARRDDHTDERLALLRHAARQSVGEVAPELHLRYLTNGEERTIIESRRWEPARVEKYNVALRGISLGEFPPMPDARRCARCPFLFVCPG